MYRGTNSETVDDALKDFSFNKNDFEFYDTSASLADAIPEAPPVSFFKDAMMRFSKNKASMLSVFVVLFVVLMAIFGPMMSSFGFREQHIRWDRLPPRVPGLEKLGVFDGSGVIKVQAASLPDYEDVILETRSLYTQPVGGRQVPMAEIRIDMYRWVGADDVYFWFGSDELGRDLWTRLWRGVRVSLIMAAAALVINLTIGVIFGSVAAYYGKTVDFVMLHIMEVLSAVPTLMLVLLLVVRFGATMWNLVFALTLTGWLGMAYMIRAQFYRYKGQEYVMAARTMGASDKRLIFRYILPNAIGPTITQVAVVIPSFMMTEAFLSYLGLGVQAPEPSVGVLLAQGQRMLFTNPHTVFFPALVISVLMLAFNLMANGLRDAFDPTLRGHQ